MTWARRTVLCWFSGLFGMILPASYKLNITSNEGNDINLDPYHDWSDVFRHLESARKVGRRFLRAYPREADRGVLVAQVERRLREASEELRRTSPDPLERRSLACLVSRAVARDFEAFRMVEIDGWQLSETEARLSALAAMDRKSA